MSVPIEVLGVRAENLRGYADTYLSLSGMRLLVGDNNQGKSGILRLLAWVLKDADEAVLSGKRDLGDDEVSLLLPANQTAGRARRLTLVVQINDRRHARRYGAANVRLRVSIQKQPSRVRLNLGDPSRNEAHEPEAMRLLRLLREKVQFLLVPSIRDGRSERFRASWDQVLSRAFVGRFRKDRPGGTPLEYRSSRTFLRGLEKRLQEVEGEINTLICEHLPPGLLQHASLELNADPASLGEWVGDRISLRVSTGSHDADHVAPGEVGNGLQSLLELSLRLVEHTQAAYQVQRITAVEEPEAFLHPSAQRGISTTLRALSSQPASTVVVTTHSPYFIDEAEYGDVVLVRNHAMYEATNLSDSYRRDVNTALLSTESAEVFFSGGVLLVEGPGEVAFFRTLLRRLRIRKGEPRLARLTVMEVGGKQRFAPWLKLIRSYGRDGDRPIHSLSLFDADAAASGDGERAALRAMRDAGLTLSAGAKARLEAFGNLPWTDMAQREHDVEILNREIAETGVCFFSADLEWATFGGVARVDPQLPASILEVPETGDRSPEGLAIRAGSKAKTGKSDKTRKKPHLRQQLAQQMSLEHVPSEIKYVVRRWTALVGLTPAEQSGLFR